MAINDNIQIPIEVENYLTELNNHVIFTYIDQWENHSIAKIQLTAQKARNDLKQLITKQHQDFLNIFSKINKSEETITNNQLNKWTKQLNKLREDLLNFSSNIHLLHDKNQSPIYFIKLSQKNNGKSKKSIPQNLHEDYINVPGTEPLALTELDNFSLNEQKQMLGERIFVLVQQIEPSLAAKITGMFIELDIKYILVLIHADLILKDKIKEAMDVLKAHRYRQIHVNQS